MSNRHVTRTDISDIDRAAEETEIERAANRQLIQEGRVIRSREMERRRREEENGNDVPSGIEPDQDSAGGSTNLSHYNSQRSSVDLPSSGSSLPRNTDARELRLQINQLEEKFKGAMMANVQLDNDKQLLRYEVDLLKDKLEDLRDSNNTLQKAFNEKKRDLAYHRMQVAELNHRLDFARAQLEARDQLIVEHNLVLLGATNLDSAPPLPDDQRSAALAELKDRGNPSTQPMVNGLREVSPTATQRHKTLVNGRGDPLPEMALISKAASELLSSLEETTLDDQIIRLFNIRSELANRVEKLETECEEQRKELQQQPEITSRYDHRYKSNGPNQAEMKQELQNARSQAQENKFKLQEALQKNSYLETDIVRLEGQIKRYKMLAESCEQQEAELKQERHKCQRELRETKIKLDDAKFEISQLQRKLEKFSRGSVAPSPGAGLRNFRESSLQR